MSKTLYFTFFCTITQKLESVSSLLELIFQTSSSNWKLPGSLSAEHRLEWGTSLCHEPIPAGSRNLPKNLALNQWNAVNLSNQNGQRSTGVWRDKETRWLSWRFKVRRNMWIWGRPDSDADLERKARVLYRFVYLNNVYAGVQVDGSFSLFAVLLILVGV